MEEANQRPDNPFKTFKDKKRFYCSPKWEKLRQVALERDNRECQECKRNGRTTVDSIKIEGERKRLAINVHHIKEIEEYPELALDIDNLETLCLKCHNRVHDKLYKPKPKNWNDEWWG